MTTDDPLIVTALETTMTTDPLVDTLTRALEPHNFADADTCACGVEYDGRTTYERHQAEVYLAAIAATGRLLNAGVVVVATTEVAAGFAERVEWATQSVWADGLPRIIRRCRGEDEARAMQAAPLTGEMLGSNVLRRTVYTGPWEAVDDHA